MTAFGYTATGEQTPARQLVTDLLAAEMAGFDCSIEWAASDLIPTLRELG
jgi:hypothetical protein